MKDLNSELESLTTYKITLMNNATTTAYLYDSSYQFLLPPIVKGIILNWLEFCSKKIYLKK